MRVADRDVEVAGENDRLVGVCEPIDERRSAEQLEVGDAFVGKVRRVEIAEDERPTVSHKAQHLTEPTVLAPCDAVSDAEMKAARLPPAEVPRVQNERRVPSDSQRACAEHGVRL